MRRRLCKPIPHSSSQRVVVLCYYARPQAVEPSQTKPSRSIAVAASPRISINLPLYASNSNPIIGVQRLHPCIAIPVRKRADFRIARYRPPMFYHVFETRDLETVPQLSRRRTPRLTRVVPRLAPSSHLSDSSKANAHTGFSDADTPRYCMSDWGQFR